MASEVYVLEQVTEDFVGSEQMPVWHVVYKKPDGTKHQHTIPKMALNWRMAEYELSLEEAIEWVLYEGWAVDPSDQLKRRADPAMQQGFMKATPLGVPDEPVTLFTADTIDEARAAQKIRIEEAKTRRHVVLAGNVLNGKAAKADPLDVMRKTHIVSVGDVQEKRLRVRAVRQGHGLDGDKPRAALELPRHGGPEARVPADDAAKRREQERRKDRSDVLFKKPLPKELED